MEVGGGGGGGGVLAGGGGRCNFELKRKFLLRNVPGVLKRQKNFRGGGGGFPTKLFFFSNVPEVLQQCCRGTPMAGARKMFLKRKSSAGAGFSC